MPVPTIEHDSSLNQAQSLKAQALEILRKDNSTADDLEKAERMITEAEGLVEKSTKLRQLKSRADAVNLEGGFREIRTDENHDKLWDSFGHYLIAVKAASMRQGMVSKDPRLMFFDSELAASGRKDLAESVASAGGFLVPTEFRPELMAAVEEMSIVRSRAMTIPMTRRSIELPALKQSGTTAGEPHWFGGMTAFWEGEAQTVLETEPAFRNIELTAWELVAVTHASNNLLADSAISLSALLTGARGFPGVIAWKEDYAFLRGTGAGQPLGVINAPCTITLASRTAANDIRYDDLVNIMNSMLPSNRAVWVANLKTRARLMLMNGPSGNPVYLWGSARDGMPDTLLGMPIIFTEKVPPLGSPGDIGLYDFSHYYIGDRQATTIESTDQERWLRNQTSWKVNHRVDGQPWLDTYFTLADGTSTVSPFVILPA